MRSKNKVVFLTDTASAIGFENAGQFAKEDAKVVITDLNTVKISYVVKSLKNEYSDLMCIECDVANESQIMVAINKTH